MKSLKILTRRGFAVLLASTVCTGLMNLTAFAAEPYTGGPCPHHETHTSDCGYVEAREAAECQHVHDGDCGYVEAKAEVPCDKGCEDTTHAEDCSYQPAVEGSECTHTHDGDCGYAEAVEGHACEYQCEICLNPEDPIPDGAVSKEVIISPQIWDKDLNRPLLNEKYPLELCYEYSYEYDGEVYTGQSEKESLGHQMWSNRQVINVLVNKDGVTPTNLTVTMKNYNIDGYSFATQGWWTGEWKAISSGETIVLPITANDNTGGDTGCIFLYHYYKQLEQEKPTETTTRTTDIMVAFQPNQTSYFAPEDVDENYAITYSYTTVSGEKVEKTLMRKDAEIVEIPNEHGQWHLKWTIEVPVTKYGVDLTLKQENEDIHVEPYVWDSIIGITFESDEADSIGILHVSQDNNPVTAFLFNQYVKQYTVTYEDGLNGEIFEAQSTLVKEGHSTPAFDGTPVRSGYTFAGWSPAVAETVTGDATYTATWEVIPVSEPDPDPDPVVPDNGGGYTPRPRPTTPSTTEVPETDVPTTEAPVVTPEIEVPEEKTPLAGLPETSGEAVEEEIVEEKVPLADVPKTGDENTAALWMMLITVSLAGVFTLVKKLRSEK